MREFEREPFASEPTRGAVWMSRIALAAVIVAALYFVLSLVPSPYAVIQPGPTVDVLGDVEIEGAVEPVIAVSDAETFDSDGRLNLVTVSVVGTPERPASWLSVIQAAVDPTQSRVPLEEAYPDHITSEEQEEQNTALMDASQLQAAAAAFSALGEPVPETLTVGGVVEQGPSDGVLEEGDAILEIGGAPVDRFGELRRLIVESGADRPLDVTVERAGERVVERIIPRIPDGGDEPVIGVLVDSEYQLPHDVDFTLSDIGGPSAGVVFALGLYEMLTPGSILDGHDISATGTIDSSGDVGPIGGLEAKLWAAERAGSELFIIPEANCADLPERAPEGLVIAPVETLDEAIEVTRSQTPLRSCR